jgi:hypothetical protein
MPLDFSRSDYVQMSQLLSTFIVGYVKLIVSQLVSIFPVLLWKS